jgi:hypothetical protein
VLESIRDSLNEQLVIPDWLVDIFLGYGDAGAAHYTQMNGLIRTVDFKVGAVHMLYLGWRGMWHVWWYGMALRCVLRVWGWCVMWCDLI